MLRRSIVQLSLGRSDRRIPIQITSQIPTFLSSRKAFSVASHQSMPQGPGSAGKPPESERNHIPIVLVGSAALGAAAFIATYQTGYLDKYLAKESHRTPEVDIVGSVNNDSQDNLESSKSSEAYEDAGEQIAPTNFQESNRLTPTVDQSENIETHSDPTPEAEATIKEENQFQEKVAPEIRQEDINHIQEEHFPSSQESSTKSDDSSINSNNLSEDSLDLKAPDVKVEQNTAVEITLVPAENENETKSLPMPQVTFHDTPKDDAADATRQPSTLLDEYYLTNTGEEPSIALPNKSQDLSATIEDSYISKDGKLVLDFLQAIHAAEQRQAELDAHTFAAEKRIMKEKYEKELKDARARELMYAEREAILDKELNKERVKAAAALNSLQEKLEEKHKLELEEKETEAELKLKEVQELAKAELTARIASEKASQIQKMAEANLHINALCMAFYAHSEEARQTHSVHKLALGALALEDALSNGLPIQKEIEALHTYLEGIDKDSLLDLVLSSLPEETQRNGTDTLLQLNHKFDALKGTLRHFSLIPPGGGGILAHSVARVASWLKVREANQSGDGIESLINRVESFLAKGKLIEAADALEDGVKGTQAAEVVHDWVTRARNRAITEQALTLLQSYATSASLT